MKTRRRNPWGLCDMLGNVGKWCQDGMRTYEHGHAYDPYALCMRARARASGAAAGTTPRGSCRAAFRFVNVPSNRVSYCGFRLSRGQDARSKQAGGGPEGRPAE